MEPDIIPQEQNLQPTIPPEKPKRWRLLKYTLGTIISLFLLIVIALFLITTVYQKKITNMVIAELNKNLKSELKVTGKVSLSLIRHFPNATVTLNDVVLGDAIENLNSPLVKAEKVSFKFGFWSLFSSHIDVKNIELDHGEINLREDKTQGSNYNIIKPSEGGAPSGKPISFSLDQATLNDVGISYADDNTGYIMNLQAVKTDFSGEFSSDQFELLVESDMLSKRISIKDAKIPEGKHLQLSFDLKVDSKNNLYSFKKSSFTIDDNLFNIDGTVSNVGKTQMDISINCNNGQLESIIALLPDEYKNRFGKFTTDGKFVLSGKIKGELSAKSNPLIDIDFSLTKGKIKHEKINGNLTDVELDGNFSNGASHDLTSSSFAINSFQAKLSNQLIKGDIDINNLSNPLIALNLDADIDLAKIYPLFGIKDLKSMDGHLVLNKFYFSVTGKELQNPEGIKNFMLKGDAKIQDVDFVLGDDEIKELNGGLQLENDHLRATDLSLKYKNSDYTFNGELDDLIPYLQAQSSPAMQNALPVTLRGDLKSSTLDLNDITELIEGTSSSTSSSSSAATPTNLSAALNIDAKLTLRIDKFKYNKIEASNVSGSFSFFDHDLSCTNISFNTMDGKIILNGTIAITDKGRIRSNLDVGCYDIDMEKLFAECENFDENAITDQNLRGKLNSAFNVKTVFNEKGNVIEDSISVDGALVVNDGELFNYSPLYDLSNYIDIKELRHIKFSTMQNTIQIKNRTVYIPMMTVHSSALNLTVSGSHTFDNEINYKIQLNLMQVLSKKFKFAKLASDEYEKTADGGMNIYITITGTVDHPIFKYDKVSVKQKIQQDLKQQNNEIKDVFKKEFGKEQQPDKAPDFEKEYKDEPLDTLDFNP